MRVLVAKACFLAAILAHPFVPTIRKYYCGKGHQHLYGG